MIVLSVLAILSVLQHNAVLSDLVRQRLSVVVQSVEVSFSTTPDLEKPLSEIPNANNILDRAKALDPDIETIHVFNARGIVVHSTDKTLPSRHSKEEIPQQDMGPNGTWDTETDTHFYSYVSLLNTKNKPVGGIVAIYRKNGFNTTVNNIIETVAISTLSLLVLFSLIGFVVIRIRLSEAIKAGELLKIWYENRSQNPNVYQVPDTAADQNIHPRFLELFDYLNTADQNFDQINNRLKEWETTCSQDQENTLSFPTQIVMSPLLDIRLGTLYERKIYPWIIGIIIVATLSLGMITYTSINSSFDPEMAKRTDLIAQIATENIQRDVSAGIPLEDMVGHQSYFNDILSHFPEISFFGVATGKFIFTAGDWQHSLSTSFQGARKVPFYPVSLNNEEVGYIIIRPDLNYIAKQFREVALDLAVVIMVVLLFAYEVIILVMTMSLNSPLNRLKQLSQMQAKGNFSSGIIPRKGNFTEFLITRLSNRVHDLHKRYVRLSDYLERTKDKFSLKQDLANFAEKYNLSTKGPFTLTYPYKNDLRLALFMFAAADELALSFFPLFTRAAENPLTWIDPSIVISLPIAGYLIAYLCAAPFARSLTGKWGHKKMILGALVFIFLSNFGMFYATNVLEIIFWRSLGGVGYAFAVLACQDYVIDFEPRGERTKSLGQFSVALFAGIFAGTALGGVLADRFGTSIAFLFSAFLVVISAILLARMIPPGLNVGTKDEAPLRLKSIISAVKNPKFFAVCMGLAVPQSLMDQVFISYLFSLQLDALNASAADIGRMLMVYFLMIMLSGTLLGWLSKRNVGESSIAVVGSLITAVGLLVAAVLPAQLTMLLAAASTGFGHGLLRGPQVELTMKLAEDELKHLGSNSVLGALRLFERGGSILGLLIIAAIAGYWGLPAAIGSIGVLILGGLVIFIIYYIGANLIEFLNKRKAISEPKT
ncbi:MFS transporter [Kiloniella antarctica]|uniref:MFS transporter n=1 Tax=Kiloniella antarctica TaxID=1550907 RepID=A0ABW5BL28_9PROT